jgi:hypothetical protein
MAAAATESAWPTRPLRGFEVVMAQLGESMGPDLIVGELGGPVTVGLLWEAAYRVQQRHPSLRASLFWPEGRSSRPWFRYYPPARDRLDVSCAPDPSLDRSAATARPAWETAVEQETARPFPLERGYAFRVVWIPYGDGRPGGHVVCSAHHALVDGVSLMRVLDDLVTACSTLLDVSRTHEPEDWPAVARRLPPVEALSPTPPLLGFLHFGLRDRALVLMGKGQWLRQQRAFLRTCPMPIRAPLAGPMGMKGLCSFRAGRSAAWEVLRRRCKGEGVTVGGAFAAAVQFAVLRFLHRHTGRLPMSRGAVRLAMTADYNMRTRLDRGTVDAHALGLFTSLADIGVRVSPQVGFWELARRLHRNTRRQVETRMPMLFQGLTDSIFHYEDWLRRGRIDYRPVGGVGDSVNISNVGRYLHPSCRGDLRIHNVFGLNGAPYSGPYVTFWLRHVDEHLCYNAVGASPASRREDVEEMLSSVFSLLEAGDDDATRGAALDEYVSAPAPALAPEQAPV